jgi:hypothetical protein
MKYIPSKKRLLTVLVILVLMLLYVALAVEFFSTPFAESLTNSTLGCLHQ